MATVYFAFDCEGIEREYQQRDGQWHDEFRCE